MLFADRVEPRRRSFGISRYAQSTQPSLYVWRAKQGPTTKTSRATSLGPTLYERSADSLAMRARLVLRRLLQRSVHRLQPPPGAWSCPNRRCTCGHAQGRQRRGCHRCETWLGSTLSPLIAFVVRCNAQRCLATRCTVLHVRRCNMLYGVATRC